MVGVQLVLLPPGIATEEPEIVVLGSVQSAIEYWQAADFWGEVDRNEDLLVPRAITVVVNESWKQEAEKMTVDLEKELFYRALLPLILHANHLILAERERLKGLVRQHESNDPLSPDQRRQLRELSTEYRVADGEGEASAVADSELPSLLDELGLRVDIRAWHEARKPLARSAHRRVTTQASAFDIRPDVA